MFRKWMAASAAAGLVLLTSAQAFALPHAIAINGPTGMGAWSGIGDACNPCTVTLDFYINAGSGLTNQLDVYDNGLISIGSAFSTMPTLTPGNVPVVSPDTSTPFFALFYDAASGGQTSMTAQSYFQPTEDDIFFAVEDQTGTFLTPVALQLTPNTGANPGSFTASWSYMSDMPDYAGINYSDPQVSGYSVNNGADSDFTLYSGSYVTFDYPSTGTPEPATWMELILGVLGVGAVLRRRGLDVAVPG